MHKFRLWGIGLAVVALIAPLGCGGAREPTVDLLGVVVPCTATSAGGFLLHNDKQSLSRWLQARNTTLAAAVDFKTNIVLIADFGEQPNPAWTIALRSEIARVENRTARVEVALVAPPAGRRVIQRVNHPCAVYKIARAGYSRVELSDGHRTLASFALD